MLIRVRSSLGIWKVSINAPDPRIFDIKQEIEKQQSIPVDQQILVFNGVVLDDNRTISSMNLSRDDILELDGRLEKETIAKSYIDDGGILVQAGTKIMRVIPSGNFSADAVVSDRGDVDAGPMSDANSHFARDLARAHEENEIGDFRSTPSPAGDSINVRGSKSTTPSITNPTELERNSNYDSDSFNYADYDFENSPKKADSKNFEDDPVRSPIESKKMVLVDAEEEDSNDLYGNHSRYLDDMLGNRSTYVSVSLYMLTIMKYGIYCCHYEGSTTTRRTSE
jgi:hypothetical protein